MTAKVINKTQAIITKTKLTSYNLNDIITRLKIIIALNIYLTSSISTSLPYYYSPGILFVKVFKYFKFFLDIGFYLNIILIMTRNQLRKKLRTFLNEKDMTLTKAGLFFGVTGQTISDFTRGKTNLNERSKYKIEKGLGLV